MLYSSCNSTLSLVSVWLWTCCCLTLVLYGNDSTRLQQVHNNAATIVDLLWACCIYHISLQQVYNRSTTCTTSATCSQQSTHMDTSSAKQSHNYYSIFTEVWCSWNLLVGRVPRFPVSPWRVRSIMLQVGLIALMFVVFGQSQASIILKKRGKLIQLWKERTVTALGFYLIRGKLQ